MSHDLTAKLPSHLAAERLALSAAVLLTRGEGAELELYLVRRAPHLSAFPGAWALPGGVLEPDTDGDPGDGMSYLVCALRELFEETGVLLPRLAAAARARGWEGPGAAELVELRAALCGPKGDGRGDLGARRRFRELVDSVEGAVGDLRPFCWTTTPAFAARRYRALYAHAQAPADFAPSILPGELVEGRFVRPADAWRAWAAGELRLVPPLVFLLEHLVRPGADLEAALMAMRRRGEDVDGGALHVVSPSPGVLMAPLRTPTLPPATTTNCYIVGASRAFVVDPGTWDEGERARLFGFLDVAQNLGVHLCGVLVTHHHRDHVGSVAALSERYSLAVYGHELTLRRLPIRPLHARPLVDGDELDLGAAPGERGDPWSLKAFHTPGHDMGHLCFLESHARALIAGDLVSTLSTIVIDPPEGHLATYLKSLARMRDLGVGAILPSHGSAAPEGTALLERYLEHRAGRERQLEQALRELGPCLGETLLPEVYADVPAALRPLAARSLVAGLEKLAEDGRAAMGLDGRWRPLDRSHAPQADDPTGQSSRPVERP